MCLKNSVNLKQMLDYKEADKLKPHPVLAGLPNELKDPACYKGIQTKLSRCMVSDHGHNSVKGFAKCKRCKAKYEKRHKMILDMGFSSTEQYLEWRKIMDIITNGKGVTISSKFVK
jgi:hypothetical protein